MRRRKRIDIRSRLDCYFLSGCVNRFFFICTPWVECGIIVYTVTDFVILFHRHSRIGRKIIGVHVSYDNENDLNSTSLFYLHEFSDSFFSTTALVSAFISMPESRALTPSPNRRGASRCFRFAGEAGSADWLGRCTMLWNVLLTYINGNHPPSPSSVPRIEILIISPRFPSTSR
jgi:hypothetical protein